jgi:hypothetical protein
MNVQNRNYEVSESAIAQSLRIHILPHAQKLVEVFKRIPNTLVKDLEQVDKPYAW